jgi:hypothetical protein
LQRPYNYRRFLITHLMSIKKPSFVGPDARPPGYFTEVANAKVVF